MLIHRPASTRLVDSLEPRRLLAGHVSATLLDGLLVIQGDAAANEILIERVATDDPNRPGIRIHSPADNTTINGQSEATFDNVRRGLRIAMGSGRDRVEIAHLRIQSGLYIDLGHADDSLTLRDVRVTGVASITGGTGQDELFFRDAVFHTDFIGTGGADRDRFRFSRVDVGERFDWIDRSGQTIGSINRLAVAGDARVQTGNSVDHLLIESSTFAGSASVKTAGRDDRITIRSTAALNDTAVDAEAGEDRIERELTFKWDFTNGAQGWTAGLSDYSSIVDDPETGQSVSDPILALPRYEYSAGIEPLPAELGSGNGFKTTSHNSADNHFMHFIRHLNAGDGIGSNRDYAVEFDIRFATNVPAGMAGVGGAPAESVILKVGAVGHEPHATVGAIHGGHLVELNVRKGNNDPNKELFPIGDIRNGDPAEPPLVWRIVRRQTTSASSVQSDSDGNVWLVAGTDSGFEGRTTLYYTMIIVRLMSVQT